MVRGDPFVRRPGGGRSFIVEETMRMEPLPDHLLTLAEIQEYVAQLERERGFPTTPWSSRP